MLSRIRPWHAALGIALLLGIAGFLYGIGWGPATPPKPFAVADAPKAVPLVAFTDAAGDRHELKAYRGRTVLLNLWATYCAPCVKELPALTALKRAVPDLTVLAVDVGRDTPEQAADFLKEHGADRLGVYLDSERMFIRDFKAYGLPLTVVIDDKGREIGRAFGAVEWDSKESVAYFRRLTSAKK
jgi:thiol-disulfide isomerase/thioredoxin